MAINNVISDLGRLFANSVVGKHKVPRYLYHFTTESKYADMLKGGHINPDASDSFDLIKGVFSIDLGNFLKKWKSVKALPGVDLREILVKNFIGSSPEKLVVLRIPTAKLNQGKMQIRSQNRLFSFARNPEFHTAAGAFAEGKQVPEKFIHAFNGDKATNGSLYKQRGEALEYIYPGSVKISDVQKLGSVEVNQEQGIKEILSKLFAGTPEGKAISFI